MLQENNIRRALPVTVSIAIALLCAAPEASAAHDKSACLAGYRASKSAQERARLGHFHEASDLFAKCVEKACGGLAERCAAARDKLSSEMSSIVALVTDDTGKPQIDVQVKIDGEIVTSLLDGRGLFVDPGLHEISFSTGEGVFASESILVAEGQRNRPVAVVMHSNVTEGPANIRPVATQGSPSPGTAVDGGNRHEPVAQIAARPAAMEASQGGAEKRTGGPSPWAFVLGGAGAVGLGAGVLLTYWGKKDNDGLSACSPHCRPSSVDHIRTLYAASDISIGLGAVSLGAAVWLLVTSRSVETSATPRAAYLLDVKPIRDGALASVSGAF